MLVFGESENDRKAIRTLAEGFRPEIAPCKELRSPLVLIKGVRSETARSNAEQIARVARAEHATAEVVAVLAHQDCDDIEPAHEAVASRIEKTLVGAGCPGFAIGVAPAWELEAWWLVFPEAVAAGVLGWRTPDDHLGRDVGRVRNAKETLRRAVRPKGAKPTARDYEEKDSIPIARAIVRMGLLPEFERGRRISLRGGAKVETRSRSLERFRAKLLEIPSSGKRR